MPYTKLFQTILTSTLWMEDDHTRIVWLTILAMKDQHGQVLASIPGLANIARVPVESCRAAIKKFMQPDPDSRTKFADGRRLEEIDGGWIVLNHDKYRAMESGEDRKVKTAERQRRFRDRHGSRYSPVDSVTVTPPSVTCNKTSRQSCQAEAEPDAEADTSALAGPEGIASLPALAVAGLAGEVPPLDDTARKARQIVAAMSVIAKSPIARRNQGRARKAIAALVLAGRDPMPILDDISNRAYQAKEPGAYLLRALESEAAA